MDVEKKDDEPELVFYYNREERLKNAPKRVRQAYDGTFPSPPKGIFEALVHTKSSKMMLIVMLITLGFTVFTIFLNGGTSLSKSNVSDVRMELKTFSFDGKLYATVDFFQNQNVSDIYIDVIFYAKDEKNNIIKTESVTQKYDGKKCQSGAVFEADGISAVDASVKINDEQKILSVSVN